MFWERFNKLCANQGKSPNAVAKELGIPSGSITAWSKGVIPRNSTLKKIADFFGISIGWLCGHEFKIDETSAASASDTRSIEELTSLWHQLNPAGKAALLDHADTLVSSGKYAHAMVKAAARGGSVDSVPADAAEALSQGLIEDNTNI